jgi:glycine hydroxymethyltransferase
MSESEIVAYFRKLRKIVKDHTEWRTRETLNLIPSENAASEETLSLLSTDFSNRYSSRDQFYRGTKYSDEIETLAKELARKLFRAKFADVRPLSGHLCSMIAFASLLRPGDKVVTCPPAYGGYPGSSEEGLGKIFRLRNLYFPFDPKEFNIIPEKTRRLVNLRKPRLVVFGASYILFPYKIDSSLPDHYEGEVGYDGSHVMGLIAGGAFQQPLSEGCDFLIGSTHKSMFGPQGGIILSNNQDIFQRMEESIYPGIVDNIHWNRVASLAYAEIELLKFGRNYAAQVIRNSKELARSLFDLGIKVKCPHLGFTKSHQALLDYDANTSRRLADIFEKAGIITDVAIRLGTSEVTRRGMKEEEMHRIAWLISDLVNGKRNSESVRGSVKRLAREFSKLEFSLAEE